MPDFDDLPFYSRPDLTPFLIHLTKNTEKLNERSAFDNLVNILKTGKICGSSSERGFIKGQRKAVCFMDVPFPSLKYILTPENTNQEKPRYEPYGIVLTKRLAYKNGCRPVLYLSNDEVNALSIPKEELWRVVRLEVKEDNWICWVHEREWRCVEYFKLPKKIYAVLVRDTKYAKKLREMINQSPDSFKCTPASILPLTIISQGLLK
ncbi:hypothetical protein V5F53_02655 [Xanthobacter sp. V4C-4]|uniref:hypothetical protein n=1 Tax=Xanthobacter cornucopiae TaxID=3119924 RepID=UPI00372C154C